MNAQSEVLLKDALRQDSREAVKNALEEILSFLQSNNKEFV